MRPAQRHSPEITGLSRPAVVLFSIGLFVSAARRPRAEDARRRRPLRHGVAASRAEARRVAGGGRNPDQGGHGAMARDVCRHRDAQGAERGQACLDGFAPWSRKSATACRLALWREIAEIWTTIST